jgi:hypothetical protein
MGVGSYFSKLFKKFADKLGLLRAAESNPIENSG